MKDLLIVDDEKVLSKNIQKHALKKKYSADTASTVEEALEKIKNNQYKVILLDVNLEDSPCGLTLIDQVKEIENTQNTKIVVFSGHVDTTDVVGLFPDLWKAIKKPVKFEVIESFINDANKELNPLNKIA